MHAISMSDGEEPSESGIRPVSDWAASDRHIGAIVGRYRVEEFVGWAALGPVYRASHVHTRKSVAIKILHPELMHSSDNVLRFEREAVATSRINHPNVARASDFEALPDGSMYLVTEYVAGQSLRELIDVGPIDVERALHLTAELAEALVAVHSAGIIHRSVKPENALISLREDGERIKLTDFGLSTFDLEHECDVITRVGATIGTPAYMAPEQVLGQWLDHRADLYSLGVVLFEMLTGRLPFESESAVRLLEMKLEDEVPALGGRIPTAVAELVHRLLAKEPDSRVQSAAELILQIESVFSELARTTNSQRWSFKALFRRLAEG